MLVITLIDEFRPVGYGLYRGRSAIDVHRVYVTSQGGGCRCLLFFCTADVRPGTVGDGTAISSAVTVVVG